MKAIKTLMIFLGVSIIFAVYVSQALLVNNKLSQDDIYAIKKLSVDKQCGTIQNYENQVTCIKAVHQSIRNKVTDFRCASRFTLIEPKEFLTRGFGCCYDRARFAEKTLEFYGFKTRHVFIIEQEYFLFNLLIPGVRSHASSEVRTSKGWLGLDSNEDFILLTSDNLPLSYEQALQNIGNIRSKMLPVTLYSKELKVYYGLYSRHGFFHGVNLPGPEINIRQIHHNF